MLHCKNTILAERWGRPVESEVPKSGMHTGLGVVRLGDGRFAIGTTEFGTMGLLPYFAPAFGVSAPVAGHVISAYALGVVVGAPVLAVALARLPRRNVLVGLMVAFALGERAFSLLPTYHWIAGLPLPRRPAAWRLFRGCLPGCRLAGAAGAPRPGDRRVLLGLTVATSSACQWP